MTVPAIPGAVIAALEDAQRFGFLGPGPVAQQIDHAAAIASVLETEGLGPADFLDLGTGGGIPGLVLAARWSGHRATLLDGSARRMAFVRRTIAGLGWDGRVAVAEGRAEALARRPELRASFRLVIARSFAAPAVTAEVGGAFVPVGGVLVVSEPSGEPDARRWPAEGLARLGLHPAELRHDVGVGVAILVRVDPVDERWPRSVGTPMKRPVW